MWHAPVTAFTRVCWCITNNFALNYNLNKNYKFAHISRLAGKIEMCKSLNSLETVTRIDKIFLTLTSIHIQSRNKCYYYQRLSIYRENAFIGSFPIGCNNPAYAYIQYVSSWCKWEKKTKKTQINRERKVKNSKDETINQMAQ